MRSIVSIVKSALNDDSENGFFFLAGRNPTNTLSSGIMFRPTASVLDNFGNHCLTKTFGILEWNCF
jgi:hypothetical protein